VVDQAVEEAKASPEPEPKDLWTDIYYKGTEPPFMRGREREEVSTGDPCGIGPISDLLAFLSSRYTTTRNAPTSILFCSVALFSAHDVNGTASWYVALEASIDSHFPPIGALVLEFIVCDDEAHQRPLANRTKYQTAVVSGRDLSFV
jgi:hypothetical protein